MRSKEASGSFLKKRTKKLLRLGAAAFLASSCAAHADEPGKLLFAANCVMCHQASGEGAIGLAPPLAGTLRADVYKADGTPNPDGQRYLSQILISGMSGSIKSKGNRFIGVMPSFADHLDDAQIAAVLGYVLQAFNDVKATVVRPEDVAAARKRNPGPADTHALRAILVSSP